MSRVGKNPVNIPQGVNISLEDGKLFAKGAKGTQEVTLLDYVDVDLQEQQVVVTPHSKSKRSRQNWGTMRALIQNAVTGAHEGFLRRLMLQGVGYRAQLSGDLLKLSLGLSHEVQMKIPEGVEVTIEGDRANILALKGANKQRLGQFASNIRQNRVPEPYGGKGIRYEDEVIVRKEGKKKK